MLGSPQTRNGWHVLAVRMSESPASTGMARSGFHRRGARAWRFALLAPFLMAACTMQQTSAFDSDAWKSQRGAAPLDNGRGAMVEGVQAAVAEGMARDEVVALLGEPDSRDPATGTETYELGVSAVGVDEEYFEVRYRDGRVASRRWARR